MTRGHEDTEARVYEDTEVLRQDTEVLRKDTDCGPVRFRTQIASPFAFGLLGPTTSVHSVNIWNGLLKSHDMF